MTGRPAPVSRSGGRVSQAPRSQEVDPAIDRGIDYLARAQLPSGELRTLLGGDAGLQGAVFDSSPFVTTQVIYALGRSARSAARPVIEAGLGFVRSEMQVGGLWRYFSSRQSKHVYVPADIDDTACASHVLALYGPGAPSNRRWLLGNLDGEGRFRTWIVPRAPGCPRSFARSSIAVLGDLQAAARRRLRLPPHDGAGPIKEPMAVPPAEVDPVANANTVTYLGESPETLAAARYVSEEVESRGRRCPAPYYPSPLALYYAVARGARHGVLSWRALGPAIVEDVLDHGRRGIESPLETALALTVLTTFAGPRSDSVDLARSLLGRQRADGSWARATYYGGPFFFWGSEELSTALAVEALASLGP